MGFPSGISRSSSTCRSPISWIWSSFAEGPKGKKAARSCKNIAGTCPMSRIRSTCPTGHVSKLMTYGRFAVPWSPPLAHVSHGAGDVQRVITEQAGKDRYDVLLWVGALFLPHLLSVLPLKNVGRHIVDFIDSPSLIKERWKNDSFRYRIPRAIRALENDPLGRRGHP